MRTGRPTSYTPELADLICERFATHAVGVRELCDMYDDMPNVDTIYVWRYKYPDFAERILNSRMHQSHILFETSLDDIREIKKYYYDDEKTGSRAVDSGIVAAQKAMAHHKMAMASKLKPQMYGQKQQIDATVHTEDDLKSLD